MGTRTPLVGRESELARLARRVERARDGRGSLLLLCGEAGVGKSRLAAEAAAVAASPLLRGAADDGSAVPYGPIVAALRSLPARRPGRPRRLRRRCAPHLALLLPELGEAAAESDRATIFEAVRCAFAHLARRARPAVVVLDDLQWSDEASLELLAALAAPLRELPVLVIAAYRSDGLPRDHRLRWLRNELRRGGQLEELALEPLDREQTSATARRAAAGAALALARARRSTTARMGSPFFVEELVAALQVHGRAADRSPRARARRRRTRCRVPDTIREAVLVATSELSEQARAAAEAAAVAGDAVRPRAWPPSCSQRGGPDRAAGDRPARRGARIRARRLPPRPRARGALRRGALDAPPRRSTAGSPRRSRQRGAASSEIATHWLGAGEERRGARGAGAGGRASRRRCTPTATRREPARQALELWPDGEDDELRIETLERYARCAELAGELAEAAKAWRELAAIRDARGDRLGFARGAAPAGGRLRAARRARRGLRRPPPGGRRVRAPATARPRPRSSGWRWPTTTARGARYGEAIELARRRPQRRRRAERIDLGARALGLLGRRAGEGRRLRAGARDGPRRARARARARPDPGRRRALPAAQPRPLRRGRLPPGGGGARHRARPLPHRRRRRHRGRLRHLPRLRAARARRVVARRASSAAS